MEEQGNSAAMQAYIINHNSARDYELLSESEFSGDILCTHRLAYLSSTCATPLDVPNILRFTVQPVNIWCWSMGGSGSVFL